jgi:hypothetical protein
MVGPGRVELAAAMWTTSVAMGLVLGQDRPQMPLAEDQHPAGNCRATAAKTARSAQSSFGRATWRRSTNHVMTQRQDLHVLGRIAPAQQDQPAKDPDHE